MRYFHTNSATFFTVRRVGFYPSLRQARTLATKLGYVLELNPAQIELVTLCLHGQTMSDEAWYSFTPKEQEVIAGLMSWWSVDSAEEFEKNSFIAINLNEGRTVAIVAKTTETLDSISYENGNRKRTSWVPATLGDVNEINSQSQLLASAETFGLDTKALLSNLPYGTSYLKDAIAKAIALEEAQNAAAKDAIRDANRTILD